MYVDNKAVLFNAENHHIETGLKHIEIRERYMLVQTRPRDNDGVIELNVRYIGTNENAADVKTKNLLKEINVKHADALYNGRFPWSADFPWISSEEGVERHGQTAYSVESLDISAGAHSRPRKILSRDWPTIERSRHCDLNRAVICVDREGVQSELVEQGWILVKNRNGRKNTIGKPRKMQGGTSASRQRRCDALRGREDVFRMCTLNMPTEVRNTDTRHVQDSNDSEKRQGNVGDISDESRTDPKAENSRLIVNENMEGRFG